MNIKELVDQIASSNEMILAGIPRNKAITLLRTAFARIGNTIENAEDGVVLIPGLGRFRVRRVERQVGGKVIARKQVTFHQPGAKGREPKSSAKK